MFNQETSVFVQDESTTKSGAVELLNIVRIQHEGGEVRGHPGSLLLVVDALCDLAILELLMKQYGVGTDMLNSSLSTIVLSCRITIS